MLHREPDSQPQIWLESPFRHMLVNDVPELRRPLVGADAVHDFPVLGEFAGEGYTEWLGLSYSFGWDLQRADEDFRTPGMGLIRRSEERRVGKELFMTV